MLFYELVPAKDLSLYMFRNSQQICGSTGFIGHLRGDFGSSGKEFHTTWHNGFHEDKNDENFKKTFDDVVNALRLDTARGTPLKDFNEMKRHCRIYPNARLNTEDEQYGFKVVTEDYVLLVRFICRNGDYNFYIHAYFRDLFKEHIKHASNGIKFITSSYRELFRIKDGEKIAVIHGSEKNVHACRYVDDYHTIIGSNLFHICEFAEKMEKSGTTYVPYKE